MYRGPAEVERVAALISDATRVTVLTGAGISTDSGIPDFRGPNGVWTVNPAAQQLSTLDRYVSDAELRKQAWRNRREHAAWTAKPNAGHRAIVDLQRAGKVRALITQNVDGLHQRAGSDPTLVIEVHGTIWQAAVAAAQDCDVLLSVGTSLQVQPVASLCDHALSAGARLVVVNAEPTPYDTRADAVLRHPISMVLPALVGRTAA